LNFSKINYFFKYLDVPFRHSLLKKFNRECQIWNRFAMIFWLRQTKWGTFRPQNPFEPLAGQAGFGSRTAKPSQLIIAYLK
jgi:hypothetical protein